MYHDTLIRIKNAQAVGHEQIRVPFDKMDFEILNILSRYRFIGAVDKKGRGLKRVMDMNLRYKDNKPVIANIKFISRPSKRIYVGYNDLKPVKQGYGLGILSTPKGIMTTGQARREKVGGEYLFQIW